ncbi:hypothetical protein DSL72_006918 [Monilinia vaccinii-corymbosi]|uniref:Uncharacterized protein n=1 Tax=Monilinia vaccinii-corymbosi TaxID=61207 RepID=A0A8A3PLQ2_9HELO|nr:hypothetical protein DSL72_006918 [Monilinia vaccinii-corymbosi]
MRLSVCVSSLQILSLNMVKWLRLMLSCWSLVRRSTTHEYNMCHFIHNSHDQSFLNLGFRSKEKNEHLRTPSPRFKDLSFHTCRKFHLDSITFSTTSPYPNFLLSKMNPNMQNEPRPASPQDHRHRHRHRPHSHSQGPRETTGDPSDDPIPPQRRSTTVERERLKSTNHNASSSKGKGLSSLFKSFPLTGNLSDYKNSKRSTTPRTDNPKLVKAILALQGYDGVSERGLTRAPKKPRGSGKQIAMFRDSENQRGGIRVKEPVTSKGRKNRGSRPVSPSGEGDTTREVVRTNGEAGSDNPELSDVSG